MSSSEKERMEHLVLMLNEAAERYYANTENGPAMSDKLYDKLMDELLRLERSTGVVLPSSPSRRVGFKETTSDKGPHRRPVLSLKDTKDFDELIHFLGEHDGLLSWKLDGVSIVLHYYDGVLINALTRGDGLVGKVILENAKRMRHVPLTIPLKDEIIVRGEGCLSLAEFEVIKKTKAGERFSNPRNLAAGIINTTKPPSILIRHMNFIAHSLVETDGEANDMSFRSDQLAYLEALGFRVVPHSKVLNFQLRAEIDRYTNEVSTFEFPVDGLVLTMDNIAYGNQLGATMRYPRHSMAFKWPDEIATSRVRSVDWSVSQTGLITPIVIFDPVNLEGTIVRRANLHTLKGFESLDLGIGDEIQVYKANKIIPEVEDNLTRSRTEQYPQHCPRCGYKTTVIDNGITRKLYCERCGGKK